MYSLGICWVFCKRTQRVHLKSTHWVYAPLPPVSHSRRYLTHSRSCSERIAKSRDVWHSTTTCYCQGHSHPKLLELKTQGCRVHNSSTLSCSQWFPGQRLFPLGYLSTNSYRTHFNYLLIKGLRVVGGDELSSSRKDERASTFSSIQVFGKSGGEWSGTGVISRRSDPLGRNSARGWEVSVQIPFRLLTFISLAQGSHNHSLPFLIPP